MGHEGIKVLQRYLKQTTRIQKKPTAGECQRIMQETELRHMRFNSTKWRKL
jgi:hypothetical protein